MALHARAFLATTHLVCFILGGALAALPHATFLRWRAPSAMRDRVLPHPWINTFPTAWWDAESTALRFTGTLGDGSFTGVWLTA